MSPNKKPACTVTLNPDTLDALVEMYAEIHPESDTLKVGTPRFEIFVNDLVDICKMNEEHIEKLKRRLSLIEFALDYTKDVLQKQGQINANITYERDREMLELRRSVRSLENDIKSLIRDKVE